MNKNLTNNESCVGFQKSNRISRLVPKIISGPKFERRLSACSFFKNLPISYKGIEPKVVVFILYRKMAFSRAYTSSTSVLDEEERISSNSIGNIVHEEGNMVVQTESPEHHLLKQYGDGFPIITSVFSLASSSSEIQTENHNLNKELIDNQLTISPLIPKTVIPKTFDYPVKGDNSPVVSSFVVNCHQDDAITVSSQTRTTGVKNEDINPGFQNFLRGCYIIAGSDTKLSNLLRVNGTDKDINSFESQSEVLDEKVEDHATNFDGVLSWKRSPHCSTEHNYLTAEQPDLIAMCNAADTTNVGIMTEREARIHRLKDLLRQKEAEVEKVRFLSKKSTLSATIDKIKLRLSTRNDSLSHQTSLAHPNKESANEQLPNAPNLDQKYRYGCDGTV
jgi:hypothetical protein